MSNEFEPVVIGNIFKVRFSGEDRFVNQEQVKIYTSDKWYMGRTESIEDLGKLGPEGVQVRVESSGNGRCWVWANYEIKSPKELTEDDFKYLRIHYSFINGQNHAVIRGVTNNEDGTFTYKAHSECDSGD
jgi:hypothetical protein